MTQTSAGRSGQAAAGAPGPRSPGSRAAQGATSAVPLTGPDRAASPGPFGRLAHLLSGSPGRLRAAGALSALACLVLALLGALAMQVRANAFEDARSHAAQVVRVSQARADLVRADAAVTNGFLAGGAEPATLTAQYDDALGAASRLLVDAAAAEPGDRDALAQANQLLADYTQQVAQARAANRQGLQLGSGYLGYASQTVLRDRLMPLLDDAVTRNAQQVDDAYSRSGDAVWMFAGGATAAVVILAGVQMWLARRTRRVVNLGLVGASVAVVAAVVACWVVLSSSGSTAADVRSTSYAATKALAQARSAAYSAKGLESLTLVKQGGGAAYEKQWTDQAKAVSTALDEARKAGAGVATARAALQQWTLTHQLIRSLDDGGNWPAAVQVATRSAAGDRPASPSAEASSSNRDFGVLVGAIDPVLDKDAARVSADLGTPWGPLQAIGWSVLVLGILAAILAVGGISQRLGEYR